jgi:hypothetical protein
VTDNPLRTGRVRSEGRSRGELVCVYVFGGGVAHLHMYLAPRTVGDALNEQVISGARAEHRLPSGLTEVVSEEFPPLFEAGQRVTAARVRESLRG